MSETIYTQLFEAQQLSISSETKYGGVVYSDSTVTKKYILRYANVASFGKAWNIVKNLSAVRGSLGDYEITVSIYVPFSEWLENKLEEEE